MADSAERPGPEPPPDLVHLLLLSSAEIDDLGRIYLEALSIAATPEDWIVLSEHHYKKCFETFARNAFPVVQALPPLEIDQYFSGLLARIRDTLLESMLGDLEPLSTKSKERAHSDLSIALAAMQQTWVANAKRSVAGQMARDSISSDKYESGYQDVLRELLAFAESSVGEARRGEACGSDPECREQSLRADLASRPVAAAREVERGCTDPADVQGTLEQRLSSTRDKGDIDMPELAGGNTQPESAPTSDAPVDSPDLFVGPGRHPAYKERHALYDRVAAIVRESGDPFNEEILAKAANPGKWNDRSAVMDWKACSPKSSHKNDGLIRAALKKFEEAALKKLKEAR